MLQRTITTLAALSVAATTAVADNRQQLDPRADTEINWSECNKTLVATKLPSECADFKVPLDYTNKSDSRTINLQIVRIKAKTQPSKGTILLNFGGPGQAGRSSLGSQADLLQAMSGYEYDLAAFDSRGTVDTIPEDCFKTPKAKQEFLESQSIWFDETPDTLSDMWDRAKYNAEECYKAFKDTQEFIGTGFVARDLISVVDALGEDGALRYWGFSYGTTLGATVASMYPERVDKMILDGVQNPHEYYHADADYEEWIDSDRVFSEIFRSCAKAGPLKCPMAAANFTGEELEEVAWSLAEKLRDDPIPVKGYPPLQYGIMRAMFTSAVYGPTGWPQLATLLSLMYTNQTDTELFTQVYESSLGGLIAAIDTYTPLFGIHGADKTARLESLEEYLPVQERLNKISKVMDGAATSVNMACGVWKSDAAGPYTGDFQTKTKNPVLFSSNKYDGHTPLQSAQNVSSGFEGSGLLVVNGFGHTTLSQPSVCTIKRTAAYWHDGSMPEEGFVCEVDGAPYSDYTWVNATLAAYKKPDNSTGNSGDDAGEDKPADVVDDSAASHNTFAISLVAIAMAFALFSTF